MDILGFAIFLIGVGFVVSRRRRARRDPAHPARWTDGCCGFSLMPRWSGAFWSGFGTRRNP